MTVSGGVAHFTNLADNLAEQITLKFTTGSLASLPTNTITVNPAAASALLIHTQPSTTATAGQAFAIQPVIYLEDSSGNIETTDNSTMVTVSLASGSGTLQGTKSVTVVNGVATFAGLSDLKAETISLKFSTVSLTAGPSNNITVSPAAPYQLLIHTQPSSSATAGQALATQPQVFEVDQFGNLETTDSTTAITASLASGNGPLQGTSISTVQAASPPSPAWSITGREPSRSTSSRLDRRAFQQCVHHSGGCRRPGHPDAPVHSGDGGVSARLTPS